MSKFTELLADPYAKREYLVTLRPYDDRTSPTQGVISLYFSTNGFTSEPSDTPPNTHYEGRVRSALSFSAELVDESRVRGAAIPSFGSIVLASAGDDPIDYLDELYWNGRECEVKLGGQLSDGTTLALSEYGEIGTFIAEGVDLSLEEFVVRIRDPRYLLEKPVLLNTYSGAGGYEGGNDLKDKPKPLVFGRVFNIEPVFLGVIGGLYSFQVNDGEVQDIDAVYSNGNALTRVDSSPGAGEYAVDRSTGTFQLGGSTLSTVITCDVYGLMDNRTSPSIWLSKPGEIVEYLVSSIAGIENIDSASITQLDSDVGYTLGLYITRQEEVLKTVNDIIESVSGYYSFNRSNEFVVGLVQNPSAQSAVEEFNSTNIISIEKLATVRPSRQIFINHSRSWKVHDLNQIAAATPEARRAFILQDYRTEASSDDPSIVTEIFPLADEERYDTFISDSTDAATEAERLQDLYGVVRRVYRVRVKTQPFQRNLGDIVSIEDSRFNLSFPRNYAIIGLEEDALSGEITMVLWG